MIYLKKENGIVNAYGDIKSLETVTGNNVYDASISEEEWIANNCTAYIKDDNIILGLPLEQAIRVYASRIRYERDKRLKTCDAISPMRWLSMTEAQQQAWVEYRIALLNIPQQEGFPWDGNIENVSWPKQPE